MMPSNAVTKLSYLIDMADWYCCEGCKHAETDGCAKEAAADASVYLEDGYLCCGLWERAEAQDPPASANLARALAAYRESERPGGEV